MIQLDFLFKAFVCCLAVLTLVESLPSEEMFNARTLEEFESIRMGSPDGHSVDETMRDELLQRRRFEKSQPLLAASFGGKAGFYHGVASGDPLPDAVIVWTRYTPLNATSVVDIEFRMTPVLSNLSVAAHLDPAQNAQLRRIVVRVSPDFDWVAKLDMQGLPSGTNFIFGFSDGTVVSDIGQTKTAPAPGANTSELVYAVFSCAHFANGYFHAYDVASTIKDLDFWIHVGDYVYEYGLYSSYASNSPERKSQILPVWEQIDLQDHRLRQAIYHNDEGLRNLRRRAPLLAEWDDHETTNNAYGQGTVNNTGAENHQPVCSANATSPDSDKDRASCDRDEGDVGLRFAAAAQAYMEWMPIRRGPGSMGVVNFTSITQVIEWGDLASVVLFDTRISYRSKDPTLRSFFSNFGAAFTNTNVSLYDQSPLKETFERNGNITRTQINDPSYTMIGSNIEIIRSVFKASKAANKTWQIWAGATMVAPHIGPNFHTLPDLVNDTATKAAYRAYVDQVLPAPTSGVLRALVAMAQTDSPWNSDDFNGFGVEREALLEIAKNEATNPIFLGGDLHDSWAWILHEKGQITGSPVAVNLGCPGVTSPGWGPFLFPALQPGSAVFGGTQGIYNLINAMFVKENPGLVYADTQFKGFFVVKATKESHTAEYIHMTAETILQNYSVARSSSGKITGSFFCGASLKTTAGVRGSLVSNKTCSAIQFDSVHPEVWNAPFPKASTAGLPTYIGCDFNACKVGAPTRAPSRSPTKVPTRPPTKAPTRAPTKAPTRAPTKAPTRAPTKAPTRRPTKAPTRAPTKAPTKTPVKPPSNPPIVLTNAPTEAGPSKRCGLLKLGLICLNGCGLLGRLLGLCDK